MRITTFILLFGLSLKGYGQADSLYTSAEDPGTVTSYASDGPAEIGIVFKAAAPGTVRTVRYYTSAAGTYSATLWDSDQKKVSTVAFTSTGRGWARVTFTTGLTVDTGKQYTATITVPKYYDSRSQALKTPLIKGNLTGLKGTHTNTPGAYPARVYDNVSYYITPVFEVVHPLVVRAAFTDTTVRWPNNNIQLKGSVSGDNVVWSWKLDHDSTYLPESFVITDLNPQLNNLGWQYYKFILTGIDRWGNMAQAVVNINVIQPVVILLTDGTYITAGHNTPAF